MSAAILKRAWGCCHLSPVCTHPHCPERSNKTTHLRWRHLCGGDCGCVEAPSVETHWVLNFVREVEFWFWRIDCMGFTSMKNSILVVTHLSNKYHDFLWPVTQADKWCLQNNFFCFIYQAYLAFKQHEWIASERGPIISLGKAKKQDLLFYFVAVLES